jgi:hypothetical protein
MLNGGKNNNDKSHHSNNINNENHLNLGDTISAHITGKVISGGGKVS